ncbi:MAG: hypothetical protein K940chlam6_00445 [Chlamydiae bacterium]|nr:hypothetical protein [Chlamydiota bacterium]
MNIYKSALLLLTASAPLLSNDCCCPPADPCAKCAQIWPTRGPDWIITPAAGPCVSRGWDAYITAEFIYWTSRLDNLGFAIFEPVQNGTTVTGRGNILHPDWKFEPGFKVGVGLLFDHDAWDLYVNYTWLSVHDTKEKIAVSDSQTQRIRPIGDSASFANLTQPILFASGRWELDFNVLDAELGRNFFISRYLKLRPHFGLKGTWQDQDYLVIGQDEELISKDQNSTHYWGVGIRAGLDTAWHFNQCFSLIGEVAITALWEKFETERKSGAAPLEVGVSEPITVLYVENDIHTLKPVLEFLLGLRYETWYCCDRYHFGIDGGWELQWWSGQNQFFNQIVESKCGDLNLNGFTLKFRLDF